MAKRRPGGPGPRARQLQNGAVKDPDNPAQLDRNPLNQPQAVPVIDPRVTDPAALRYAQGAQRRIQKYAQPRAGGPTPAIPPLTADAMAGMTMSEQAERMRAQAQPEAAGAPQGGIFSPQAAMPQPSMGGRPGAEQRLPLQAGDILPDAAMEDPAYQSGPGSRVAMNQPHLAAKYGVMRGGEFISAQRLQGNPVSQTSTTGKLSDHTAAGLKAIQEFNVQRKAGESGATAQEQMAEQDAKDSLAGQHSETGGGTPAKMTSQEQREILQSLDEYDMSRVRRSLMRDMLNNEEQKQIIESRLKELDLAELVINGRVTQMVPVIPDKFEIEYQSYAADEDLEVKRLITTEANSMSAVGDQYFIDKFSLMGLTVALRKINKKPLPDHNDAEGNFSEENFWKKFNIVKKFNFHMIASLIVNWLWFDMRVRKLFVAEKVGNG